jgi:prophage maintenance system killer protein
MTEPRWLSVEDVTRLHSMQIAEFGGSGGIRDYGLLEAAVMRPNSAITTANCAPSLI